MPPTCVKKIISAGKGPLPQYVNGAKSIFHYEVQRPVNPQQPLELDISRDDLKLIDSTRKSWPEGYGKPLEIVFGKKFQLPVFENCLQTMLVDEIAQFDIDPSELVCYPMVSKKLRDIVKPHKHGHSHSGHSTHMCAASLSEGTGYPELDEYMKTPTALRVTFHVLEVQQPSEYEPERWQLSNDEKLNSVETLRAEGNELFKQGKVREAIDKYREGLTRVDNLLLREKPGEPEWEELDAKNVLLFLNLSQCYLTCGDGYEAIQAANEVLDRDPKNEKALFRRAKARLAISELNEAEQDYIKLKELRPDMGAIVDNELDVIKIRREQLGRQEKSTSAKMMQAFKN